MGTLLRAATFVCAALLVSQGPAHASGNFLCQADDEALKFNAESTFSHGLGGTFVGFGAELAVRLKKAPADFAVVKFDAAQLVHHWFTDGALNLHVYRERAADAPHGYVELIIETIQEPDDETAFSGTYKLIVHDVPASEGAEGMTLDAEGKISCSVG